MDYEEEYEEENHGVIYWISKVCSGFVTAGALLLVIVFAFLFGGLGALVGFAIGVVILGNIGAWIGAILGGILGIAILYLVMQPHPVQVVE